jgi:hypothetical protein
MLVRIFWFCGNIAEFQSWRPRFGPRHRYVVSHSLSCYTGGSSDPLFNMHLLERKDSVRFTCKHGGGWNLRREECDIAELWSGRPWFGPRCRHVVAHPLSCYNTILYYTDYHILSLRLIDLSLFTASRRQSVLEKEREMMGFEEKTRTVQDDIDNVTKVKSTLILT